VVVEGNGDTNDKSYAIDTPVPNILPKEGDITQTAPFPLTTPDFLKTEVLKAYDHTVVAPVIDYWKHTIEVKKGVQVERILNRLHSVIDAVVVKKTSTLVVVCLDQKGQGRNG